MAGADLRRCFSVYFTLDGTDSTFDPEPGIQPHASMLRAAFSYTALECAKCKKYSKDVKACGRCRLAQYCCRECQVSDFYFHKKCCKRLRKGQDMVSENGTLPKPNKEPFGFKLLFAGDDFKLGKYDDEEEEDEEERPVWEYNAGSRDHPDWKRYPVAIEESLEMFSESGMRYMYRPGNPDAEGMYEPVGRKSARPPPNVATNYVYFDDMLEREVYTGAIRAVRRNGSRDRPES